MFGDDEGFEFSMTEDARELTTSDEPLPAVNSIHLGRVKSIQDYGAFIAIEGFKKQGLCHITQITKNKLEGKEGVKILYFCVYLKI
jgi:polyribonucleotide nucleotidyltransferase